jgi:hypothetical protein
MISGGNISDISYFKIEKLWKGLSLFLTRYKNLLRMAHVFYILRCNINQQYGLWGVANL